MRIHARLANGGMLVYKLPDGRQDRRVVVRRFHSVLKRLGGAVEVWYVRG